jgi:hypothetical protein
MKESGLIDRLDLTPRHAWENHRDLCYVQEYRSGALCTRELILFAKLDTLPYRRGVDNWLAEEAAALQDPGVFAISLPGAPKPISRSLGMRGAYLASDFVSLCFALMKRTEFVRSCREQMGEFIDSGFRGEYPSHIAARPDVTPGLRRALVELLWTEHCRKHGLAALARKQTVDYQINHVNVWGPALLAIRSRYRAREDVGPTLNRVGPYKGPRSAYRRMIADLEALTRARIGLRKPKQGEAPQSVALSMRALLGSMGRVVMPMRRSSSSGLSRAGDRVS